MEFNIDNPCCNHKVTIEMKNHTNCMALSYLKPAINLIRFTMYKMADTKMTND